VTGPASVPTIGPLVGAGAGAAATVSPIVLSVPSLATVGRVPAEGTGHLPRAARPPAPSRGLFNVPLGLAAGGLPALSLEAATRLSVPILFGVLVGLLLLVQGFVGRKDPKVARAPERGEDDTVGFV
jgi:hypothetical protein